MNANINKNQNRNILYKELSYKLQGVFFKIRNELGSGHKESIYQNALAKELEKNKIIFQREYPVKIYSKEGYFLGLYKPDFVIDNKIIIEVKARSFLSKQERIVIYDYLKNSEFEVAYIVNFGYKNYFSKDIFLQTIENHG
ncbi:MAG: hypothetical protein KatS3mg095_0445 [Candidatus Parcubacteria bacterium]|nr:MAG: hypothetical protein KatS3mg095_0445 [Candidatus Parcubacteria bacterium]